MLQAIAFDADDTLWHNESIYAGTQSRFTALLARYHEPEWVLQRLYETEMRNLAHYGYGIKGFALSMVETAIELTEGRISGLEIQEILEAAKEMLRTPIQLLDGVQAVIERLAASYPLMLITKGDLLDQETKIGRSGLADRFAHIEIVSDKTPETYAAILARRGLEPPRFLMIGNSLRSDVLPVLKLGGWAVHIPYRIVWPHEQEAEPEGHEGRFFRLDQIEQLPALVERIEVEGGHVRTAGT